MKFEGVREARYMYRERWRVNISKNEWEIEVSLTTSEGGERERDGKEEMVAGGRVLVNNLNMKVYSLIW